ncbi:MDR family MFS transporter [Actinoallomurus rhizosphaericola]|uniref:MDR family MFS transporter n=1 Tax=Actinoallomurus rhizosphaericola TaxID=2952536 RepID=UPI0020920EAF|nr:MDR family MFS transporter [Actinoallomurus rhizosphaericola]MCO5999640.1 MFS transporter [Actinoallomurus rhizosphaericola]
MTSTAPPEAARRPKTGLLIVAVLGGMFLAMLDQTIVGTSLPRIVQDLRGEDLYTWVVTAYLLTSTITVPLYGRLSDVHGRKPLLLIGVTVFLIGSALCAVAQNMPELIAFRALQGLGAGALIPLSLALVADLFPPENSGRIQGAVGGVMALSYVAGPYLGGLLTEQANWRWVFLVNLPVGVVVLAVIALRLPHVRRERVPARPDYLGIAVFAAAIGLLLFGLTEKGRTTAGGATHAWTSGTVAAPIAASLALLAGFVLVERRAAEPIVPLGLFRNRTYTAANVGSFFTAFGMYAAIIFLPRYFQEVHGDSASTSGLKVYPLMLGMLAGSFVTGALISRTRRYKPWLVAAPALLAAGSLLCAGIGVHTGVWALAGWMALIGLGIGPMLSGLTIAVQNAVEPEHIGTATSKITFFRQVGGSVALAIAGTAYASHVRAAAPAHGLTAASASATATVIPWLGTAGAAIALVVFALMPESPLRRLAPSAPVAE